LRSHQESFARSGGLHGAALVDGSGALIACREDIGRHNAVDKIIGWALDRDLDLGECVLVVSARAGYEIVHKAVVAGVPIVVAISAASSLAVDLAERWRTTLVGFVRDASYNVYSHHWRIRRV
jgi:FdhD protein